MKPRVLDDWWWFIMCYWMVLFSPVEYMMIIRENKHLDVVKG